MTVCVERYGDSRMPKPFRNHLGMYTDLESQSRPGMADIVQANDWHSGRFTLPFELA